MVEQEKHKNDQEDTLFFYNMEEAFSAYCLFRKRIAEHAYIVSVKDPEKHGYGYLLSWFWERLATQTIPPMPTPSNSRYLRRMLEARCKIVKEECRARDRKQADFSSKCFADDIHNLLRGFCAAIK